MLLPYEGRKLCYDLVGPDTGEVVLLSHSLGADLGMWAEQVPALADAGYRVLRWDMPGHGGSDALPPPYTINQLADIVVAALDHLQVPRVHFVGLSIGGMIGQSLGIRFADRLHSLMLCDTQTQTPDNFSARIDARVAAITPAGSCAVLADDTLDRWLTAEYKAANPLRWGQIRDTVACCTLDGYIGCARAICNFNYTDRLKTIETRTLVACGTDDPSSSPAVTRQTASLLANGSYAEFPGAKHLPNVEDPADFNRVLLAWLAGGK